MKCGPFPPASDHADLRVGVMRWSANKKSMRTTLTCVRKFPDIADHIVCAYCTVRAMILRMYLKTSDCGPALQLTADKLREFLPTEVYRRMLFNSTTAAVLQQKEGRVYFTTLDSSTESEQQACGPDYAYSSILLLLYCTGKWQYLWPHPQLPTKFRGLLRSHKTGAAVI